MSDCISLHDLSWQIKFSQQCTECNDDILHRSTTKITWKPIPNNVYTTLRNSTAEMYPSALLERPIEVRSSRDKGIESPLKKKAAEAATCSSSQVNEAAIGPGVSTPTASNGDVPVVSMNPKVPDDKKSDSGYDSSQGYYFILLKLENQGQPASQNATDTAQMYGNAQVLGGNTSADEPEAMVKVQRGTPFASIWQTLLNEAQAIFGNNNFTINPEDTSTSMSALLEGPVTKDCNLIVTPKDQ